MGPPSGLELPRGIEHLGLLFILLWVFFHPEVIPSAQCYTPPLYTLGGPYNISSKQGWLSLRHNFTTLITLP